MGGCRLDVSNPLRLSAVENLKRPFKFEYGERQVLRLNSKVDTVSTTGNQPLPDDPS